MKDQRGMSLIELLIAFAIAAIVMTGLGYMIFSSLSLYGRNNANVEVQNEAQTSMNLILDTIMEAGGLCTVGQDGLLDNTCIILGKTFFEEQASGYTMYSNGYALVYDPALGEIYLISLPGSSFSTATFGTEAPSDVAEFDYTMLGNGSTKEEAAAASITMIKDVVSGLSQEERLPWLLGKNVTGCSIQPANYNSAPQSFEDEEGNTKLSYEPPYTITVEIHFEIDYKQATATRDLTDDATIRNRMNSIYVSTDSNLSSMTEYVLQK